MREAVISLDEDAMEALGLEELVSITQAAGIRDFEEFACYGTGAVVQVEVEEPLPEEELQNLEYVDRLQHVDTDGDSELYLIAFRSPELSSDIENHADDLIGTCDPHVGDRSVRMSFVGPQDAIRGTVGEYRSAGALPDLRQLGTYEGRQRPLDSLTDRQREVIETAHEMGYYEIPRPVTTSDVAGELDIDSSTVSEHLQRAERNLLSEHLDHG